MAEFGFQRTLGLKYSFNAIIEVFSSKLSCVKRNSCQQIVELVTLNECTAFVFLLRLRVGEPSPNLYTE